MKVLLLFAVLVLIIRTSVSVSVSVSASIASINGDDEFKDGSMESPYAYFDINDNDYRTTVFMSMADDSELKYIMLLERHNYLYRSGGELELEREMDEKIQRLWKLQKNHPKLAETLAEMLARKTHELARELEALGAEEARLMSQLHNIKRGCTIDELGACKIPVKHDQAGDADQLVQVQVPNSEELFSTQVALTHVCSQILRLVKEKLIMEIKQGILKSQYGSTYSDS